MTPVDSARAVVDPQASVTETDKVVEARDHDPFSSAFSSVNLPLVNLAPACLC